MKNITSPCKVFTSLWVRLQSCESEKSGKDFTKAIRCPALRVSLKSGTNGNQSHHEKSGQSGEA